MSLFYKKSVILKIKKTSYFKWQGQINYSKCTIYYLLNIHFFFSPFLFLSKRFRIFSGQWKPVKEIVKGTELGVVIKDLEPLTKYEVKVAATTIAGAGNYETRSATTIEKPGPRRLREVRFRGTARFINSAEVAGSDPLWTS